MKSLAVLTLTLGLCGLPAAAQETAPAGAVTLDAASLDPTGTWNYRTSDHAVEGICPRGREMEGELTISREDDRLALVLQSGAVCVPAGSCSFDGAVEDGDLVVTTAEIVDDEGGTATSVLRLSFLSASQALGEASIRYAHPGGFACHWTHLIAMDR